MGDDASAPAVPPRSSGTPLSVAIRAPGPARREIAPGRTEQDRRSARRPAVRTVTAMETTTIERTEAMTDEGATRRGRRGGPGPVSRWMQHKANARVIRKLRQGRGTFMGMDVLVVHHRGRRSGRPYETPVAWFAGDGGDRLVVASGGGERDPDWYRNLVARPDEAAIELAGGERVEVRPEPLAGAEREAAWARMAAAQPRTATYQAKTERRYPVVRLTAR